MTDTTTHNDDWFRVTLVRSSKRVVVEGCLTGAETMEDLRRALEVTKHIIERWTETDAPQPAPEPEPKP